MLVAVISDIHSNIFALDKVLIKIQQQKVDFLIILGDIIGYFYWPSETLERLSTFKYKAVISGNHEELLRKAYLNHGFLENVSKKYSFGIKRCLDVLTVDEIQYLITLPPTLELYLEKDKFILCHGSPMDPVQYIYPDADKRDIELCFEKSDSAKYILCGHTHYPFINIANSNQILLNPGSVGQPRDIGNLASWVTINTENQSIVFHRTQIDVKTLRNESLKFEENEYLLKTLTRNL